jgi:hypothetical protein
MDGMSVIDRALQEYLGRLPGQPFLFARGSYLEELKVHFGVETPMNLPKFPDVTSGSYIVTTRDSGWVWRGEDGRSLGLAPGERPSSDEMKALCARIPTKRGALVIGVHWGMIQDEQGPTGRSLLLRFSGGSSLWIYPDPDRAVGSQGEKVADWELWTPDTVFRSGPGWEVGMETRKRKAANG